MKFIAAKKVGLQYEVKQVEQRTENTLEAYKYTSSQYIEKYTFQNIENHRLEMAPGG